MTITHGQTQTRSDHRTFEILIALALLSGLILSSSVPAAGESTPARPKVAILVFDNIQLFDFMGPYDVLTRDNDVYLVAEKPMIETYGTQTPPVKIIPQYTFANAPQPDVLVIPGGGSDIPGKPGVGLQLQNAQVLKWVKDTAQQSKYVLTVCNGNFIAAEAGLLDGLTATTFHTMIDHLQQRYPKVHVVDNQRFVDNGKLISTAGITSGVDGALHLNAKMHGHSLTQLRALSLEYNWDPDSKFVRAALPDMSIPQAVYTPLEPAADLLDYSGNREVWVSTWHLKIANFPELAERMAKSMDEEPKAKRSDATQLQWSVIGRDDTHWILTVENPGPQDVTIRFKKADDANSKN